MGIIYDCLSKYDKALEEYKYAINLTRNIIPNGLQEDRVCLIPLYSNMGLTYQQLNQHKHAFDHAYRTLNILSKDGANTLFKKELSASSHFNLGLILDLQGKNQEAKTHYEQALKNRMEYLPNNHRDVIDLQKLIASLSSQSNESAD
jgi:tetratricopeptide (TPR) repeat protein